MKKEAKTFAGVSHRYLEIGHWASGAGLRLVYLALSIGGIAVLFAIHWVKEDAKGGSLIDVTNLPADSLPQAKEKAVHLFDSLGVVRGANRIEVHKSGISNSLWSYP